MNEELRELLAEVSPDMILWTGFDDAIIGIGERCGMPDVIIYDKDKIIEIMVQRDECTEEEAMEFYEYNILGSYVGEGTPITMQSIGDFC